MKALFRPVIASGAHLAFLWVGCAEEEALLRVQTCGCPEGIIGIKSA